MTAEKFIRAQRIFSDKKRKSDLTLDIVLKELEARDERDKTRAIAPLIVPQNAVIVDNSELSEPETLEMFLSYIKS